MAPTVRIAPLLAVIAVALGVVATADPRSAATNGPPLRTAVMDPTLTAGADLATATARIRAAGATAIRLNVDWGAVAPGPARSASFDPANPQDPGYRFAALDAQVRRAVAAGLQPILSIFGAPRWAETGRRSRPQDGPTQPSPRAYGDFATAVARRYGGNVDGLPRVRYFQAWNEPNITLFLMPQLVDGAPVSPGWYRRMRERVHATPCTRCTRDNVVDRRRPRAVHATATVVGAGRRLGAARRSCAQLLCLSLEGPQPTCHDAGPLRRLGDAPVHLGRPDAPRRQARTTSRSATSPKMRPVLDRRALARATSCRARPPQFWVTEFSWDSKPPDPHGVPLALHARWVAEALYRMWQNGVSLVTWFRCATSRSATSDFQSGLYFRGPRSRATGRSRRCTPSGSRSSRSRARGRRRRSGGGRPTSAPGSGADRAQRRPRVGADRRR